MSSPLFIFNLISSQNDMLKLKLLIQHVRSVRKQDTVCNQDKSCDASITHLWYEFSEQERQKDKCANDSQQNPGGVEKQ